MRARSLASLLVWPGLGMLVVLQDPSDNVPTTYLQLSSGLFAQDTPVNRAKLRRTRFSVLSNGSDNRLLVSNVDPALGCTGWNVTDLADTSATPQKLDALPLNEIQASIYQAQPQALLPALDDFVVTVAGALDLDKLNAYRAGVNQVSIASVADDTASSALWCKRLYTLGATRIWAERSLTQQALTIDPTIGTTLFTFLVSRLETTLQNLQCASFLAVSSPFVTVTNANGVLFNATLNASSVAAAAQLSDQSLYTVGVLPPALQLFMAMSSMDVPGSAGTAAPIAQAAQLAASGAFSSGSVSSGVSGSSGSGSSGSTSSFHMNWASFGIGVGAMVGLVCLVWLVKWCIQQREASKAMTAFQQRGQV